MRHALHLVLLLIWLGSAATGPSLADGAPIEPLPVTRIADGIFVAVGPHELATPENADHISNAGFIIGEEAVAVIDTGGSALVGRRLLAAVRAQTDKPIRYVIDTHDHPDHLLGNAAFVDSGAQIVGHRNLPEAIRARAEVYLAVTRQLIGETAFAGTRILEPTLLVQDRLTLDLGNRRLQLEAWPPAHTDNDLTVLDERTQTWFLGDLLFSGHVPALDGSLKGWLSAIIVLRSRAAARVVPGHGPAVMDWPDALGPMERYLQALAADVRRDIAAGRTMQMSAASAATSEREHWALFDDFNSRNAIAAYHELEWE